MAFSNAIETFPVFLQSCYLPLTLLINILVFIDQAIINLKKMFFIVVNELSTKLVFKSVCLWWITWLSYGVSLLGENVSTGTG